VVGRAKTRGESTVTTVGGITMAVAGGAMLTSLHGPGQDSNGNGVDEFPDNEIACALGGCTIATTLLITGVVMAVVGLATLNTNEAPSPTPAPAPAVVAVAPVRTPSLPEVASDQWTIGLAQQARNLAQDGHCDGALVVVGRIASHDATYATALEGSPALASCPPAR
jgi:hypothetical protein